MCWLSPSTGRLGVSFSTRRTPIACTGLDITDLEDGFDWCSWSKCFFFASGKAGNLPGGVRKRRGECTSASIGVRTEKTKTSGKIWPQASLKVARNKFKNTSFAQRSAHRDSRIWRQEMIDSPRSHSLWQKLAFSPLHSYTHRIQRLVWVPWCDSRNRASQYPKDVASWQRKEGPIASRIARQKMKAGCERHGKWESESKREDREWPNATKQESQSDAANLNSKTSCERSRQNAALLEQKGTRKSWNNEGPGPST